MSETTLEAALPAASQPPTPRPMTGRRVWVLVGVGLVVVSALLLVWARTRPGYDPYGWLVWGYQTLHLSLDLGGAPSWKPLPFLFALLYALAGRFDLWLWMITAVSISLAGCVFAGRIAYRVTREQPSAEKSLAPAAGYAPLVAAIFAGAAVLGVQDYMHYILSVQSDPMIVTFCLAAIDMCLCRRYRWALAFAVLGSLGRPEVWPFLCLYTIWAWFKVPDMRLMLVGAVVLVAVMWFGIPWITNGRPDVAGQLAMNTPPVLHNGQVGGTIDQFATLQYLPVWMAALAAIVIGVRRGYRVVLILAGGVVLWVSVESVFALHGFPVLPRFMFEAGAVGAVLAGIGIGLLVNEQAILGGTLPRWSGVAVAVVLTLALVPGVMARISAEGPDLQKQRSRSEQIRLLQATIKTFGGYRAVRACGEPVTNVAYASALAWLTHLDVGHVGYKPGREIRSGSPIVVFMPVSGGGWQVRPWHTPSAQRVSCSNLQASYLITGRHPSGTLVYGRHPEINHGEGQPSRRG